MPTSILEYLASLRQHGHVPQQIGNAQIGRTLYAVGSFLTPAHPAPKGSRAAREGRLVPEEIRLVLLPVYTVGETHGRRPSFLPASYRRDQRTIFRCSATQAYYVSGWNEAEGLFWLNDVPAWMLEERRTEQAMSLRFDESFETAMNLAGPEVLARISATAETEVGK